MARSKARWCEHGERNSKYFYRLEKRNYNTKYITELKLPDKTTISGPSDIFNEGYRYRFKRGSSPDQFYKELCTSTGANSDDQRFDIFFNNPVLPEISADQKQSCEGLLTKDECFASLKQMAKGKSLGSDGLSVEFYLAFWESVGQELVDSLNYAFECGELTISQRRGIITLIPKKNKNKTLLDNWRPISLLNTDYEIATRAITSRISKILPSIIHSDQTASLMNVELRSEGCDDPGKTWCGVAFIKVNNQDYSLHKRGFNVAVFTEQGLFLEARAFDTYGVVKAGTSVANYLNRLHGNKIVLVAVQDSADTYGSAAIGALKRLGAREPIILEFRSSFALAGFTGSSLPSWVSQAQNKRYKGPSVLLVTIEGGCSCFLPLGMESRHLPDSTLSASSSYNANHAPQRSRLNTVPSKGKVGAWCARKNNAKQGLQVKFGRETTVTKVATQGRYDGNHWVMSYSLSYSVDGSHWAWYRLSDGQVKVFGGNVDRNTPVYHLLHPRVQAKYVRFHPRTWYGHICMRAELYGCSVHRCLMSLGLEDGRIQDGAMSASSIWDSDHATKLGRLNLVASSGKAGAWCVKTRDAHQWLQIDLGKGTTVTKVATQGRQDANQWVTSYSISYSPAKSHWVYVMTHGKKTVFAGNFDRNSIVAHEILPPFHAYLVKIHPGSYYGWMSMRVELYGCPIKGIKG
ncbi:hypothetical protein ACROYT_G016171 [Oculina patagonica]